MREYLEACKRPSYNFVFAVLLLVIYEGAVWLMRGVGRGQVVNAVDALFDALLAMVPYGTWVLSLGIVVAGFAYLYIDSKEGVRIQPRMLLWMLLESFVWALILVLVLPRLMAEVFVPQSIPMQVQQTVAQPTLIENIGLSFGAGFYEEFFFRLVLYWLIGHIIGFLGGDKDKAGSIILNVLLCSLLFSAAHYIGSMGDKFTLYSFTYRFVFGLIMAIMLVARRFGITAWTHALYDVLVYVLR